MLLVHFVNCLFGQLIHDQRVSFGVVPLATAVSQLLADISYEESDMDRCIKANSPDADPAAKASRGRLAYKVSEAHCEVQGTLGDDFCKHHHVVCKV